MQVYALYIRDQEDGWSESPLLYSTDIEVIRTVMRCMCASNTVMVGSHDPTNAKDEVAYCNGENLYGSVRKVPTII